VQHDLLLIVRDQAHENAFAKALETLGVNWGAALPIPKTNAEQYPEVKKLLDQGLHNLQYTFNTDNESQADKLFRGASPSNDGAELKTAIMHDGVPIEIAPERREEFSPGLDAELLQMIQATARAGAAQGRRARQGLSV
jgi:Mn-containing catalase